MTVSIRTYRAEDRASVIGLWEQVFTDQAAHNTPSRVIDAKLAVDDLLFMAIDSTGRLRGTAMAGYDGHRGWLYSVAVHPDQRHRGIGRQLVRYALRALAERGCAKVNLQIRADNIEVQAFYEALGFQREERISMGMVLKGQRPQIDVPPG